MSAKLGRWVPRCARGISNTAGNATEMAHFADLASSWWDPAGPQRILHKMNLMRLDFMQEVLSTRNGAPGYNMDLLPLEERRKWQSGASATFNVLDVGCGGGLLSESIARWPQTASVVGIDVTPEVIAVAKDHAALDPSLASKLDYKNTSVGEVKGEYDIVTMFEVLEHLDQPGSTLEEVLSLVKPGGYLFLSTINRTLMSWLTTIVTGEYLLGIVPPGTHTWSKYINETELRSWFDEQPQWGVVKSQGCIYLPPPIGEWSRFDHSSKGLQSALNCAFGVSSGNYLLAARKSS